MIDNNSNDTARLALMRIEDIESRLNRQLRPVGNNSVVLQGRPRVWLNNRTVILGRIVSMGRRLSIVFKYSGASTVQLLVNNMVATIDQGAGIAFATVTTDNREIVIQVRGTGRLDSYQLHATGYNMSGDSASSFGFDYSDGQGLALISEGGIISCVIVSNTISQPFVLMAGYDADVVAHTHGYSIVACDTVGNVWLMRLNRQGEVISIKAIARDVDSVAIGPYGQDLSIALLNREIVSCGRIVGDKIVELNELSTRNVKGIKWVKNTISPVLLVVTQDGRTSMRTLAQKRQGTQVLNIVASTRVN